MECSFTGILLSAFVTDIDECSDESNPCDSEREVCHNMVGSYVCKCQDGLFKSSEGTCVTEEELPPEDKPQKVVKKKKKSKKGKQDSKDASSERPHYPWYYLIGPLTLLFLVSRFASPILSRLLD